MNSFRAWESWAIYPSDFLVKLQNIFLGLVRPKTTTIDKKQRSNIDDDIDGRPLALVADYDDEEDIDGKPIGATKRSIVDDDIDGRPIGSSRKMKKENFVDVVFFSSSFDSVLVEQEKKKVVTTRPPSNSSTFKPRFVATKWETVDPNAVAAQGICQLSRKFSSLKIFSSPPKL